MTYFDSNPYPDTPQAEDDTCSNDVVIDCLNMLAASVDLDTATNSFLETLGCFYQASGAYVLEADLSGASFTCTFSWQDGNICSVDNPRVSFPAELFQEWLSLFETEGTLSLSAGDNRILPAKNFHRKMPVFLMAAPLYVNTHLTGFLCVADPLQHFGDMKVLLAIASLTVVELRKLRLMEELDYLHRKDPLTDTYNRFSYVESLARSYQNTPSSMGVIAVSVNGLKEVNTVLGDKFGDAVVQRTAEIMRSTLQADVYRIGGDEFLSMHPDISADAFQQALSSLHQAFSEDSGCDVAIGSSWAEEYVDTSALIIAADKELLQNKAKKYRQN